MNRAVQYLRRLSQDPQSTQIIISHKQLEFVSACILPLVIYCCNKASNRIVTRSKDLVFYSWIPLSPEVSRLSPYTHAQQHTQTSRIFYIFEVTPTRYTYKDTPSRKLRYLGTDETVLSLQALINMYLVIAENLHKARERITTP